MGELTLGKLAFGKDAFHFGLELCLSRAGLSAFGVTEKTVRGCDILLVSMFWYRDIYSLELFLRRAGIKKNTKKPYILAGGIQATLTPKIVAEMVDGVFVGDADDALGEIIRQIQRDGDTIHPNVYHAGDAIIPSPATCKPSAFSIKTNNSAGVMRVEIARGCKYKCAFCVLSGLKPYQEVSFDDLRPLIKQASGSKCSFFAPERTVHSEWSKIKEALHLAGAHDLGQDARLEHLQEVGGASVTFGLEGISDRLRRSVGKPFSDKMVMDQLGRFVETRKNIARVSAYFIADLPGENEDDWRAIWSLFEQIGKADWSRRLVLCPVLNPLSPKPFTKLQGARINLFSDYGSKWQSLLRRNGGQWGFRIIETLVWGPLERTMDALVQRGGQKAYNVVNRLPDNVLKFSIPVKDRTKTANRVIDTCIDIGITLEQLQRGEEMEMGQAA